MTEPREPIDHFIATDPVRLSAQPMPDTDRMVRRAIAGTSRPRVSGSFRARIASAALGATLVTGFGVSALQSSAPSLPVLALSNSASPTATNGSDSKMAGSMLRPMVMSNFHFDGSTLSELPSHAPVWKLTSPSDLKEFHQIAAALGLRGDATVSTMENVPGTSAPDATYTISDPDKGTLTYSSYLGGGAATWWFGSDAVVSPTVSSDGSTTNASSVSDVSESQYLEWAQGFVSSLHLGYTFATPEVYLYDAPDMASAGASVSYTVLLDGLKTNIGLYVSLDSKGHVTSASGTVGSFERVGNYPLISVAEGVAKLQDENDANNQGLGSPAGISSVGIAGSPQSSDVHVSLTSVTIELQLATVDGVTYLIPYYVYSGSAITDGETPASWDGMWTTIAVSPKYITIDAPTVMPMAAR